MIASCLGVLMMTLPGFILYYAGMARASKVLTTIRLVFSIFCIITLCWFSFGYSLSFGPRTSMRPQSVPVYGDASRLWLRGMVQKSAHELAPTIPEFIFCVFELAFAIATVVLVVGSFADRVKFFPVMLFCCIWHFVVYCPIAHSVWHPDGFLYQAGVMDFAGGNVVHISAGCSALVACAVVGNNYGFSPERFFPHNILLTFMGVCLVFVGWLSFNGGSALNATDGRACLAVLNTIISSSAGAVSWAFLDSVLNRDLPIDAQFIGMMNGLIAGLVTVTPACGFIDANGAFWIGIIGGLSCNLGAKLKHYAGWDDALDAFGIHATGGAMGTILTGFFAIPAYTGMRGSVFYSGLKAGGTQLGIQIYSVVVCAGWSAFASFVILTAIELTIGLRDFKEDIKDSAVLGVTLDKHRYGDYESAAVAAVAAAAAALDTADASKTSSEPGNRKTVNFTNSAKTSSPPSPVNGSSIGDFVVGDIASNEA